MIEIQDYRFGERLARSVIASWWLAETHQVDHFARSGFPVRIESIHEVGQLLDTMQENRYERFLKELGGLSADDVVMLTRAIVQAIKFQLAHLPRRQPIMPFSTMISSLALYKKIVGFKPEVESVLEVGPGCGYLSFFLEHHFALKDYSQIEACESFYILQSMINSYLFRHEFKEFAIGAGPEDQSLHLRKDVDTAVVLSGDELPSHKCFHYPWWMLKAVGGKKYDIVTSNANLNEFSRHALRDYLTIFSQVLKDDGIFLVQCTGFTAHGSLEDLFDVLYEFRFAPVFCALAAENIRPEMLNAASEPFRERGFERKEFVLNNIALVRQTHPYFSLVYERRNYRHGFASDYEPLAFAYKSNSSGTAPSKQEFSASIKEQLLHIDDSGKPKPRPKSEWKRLRIWRS
jgi:hypothetical protein